MSGELTRARQQLSQVRVFLKQDKIVPAAQAIQSALGTMLKTQLIKGEREEFVRAINEAMDYFFNNDLVLASYPLKLVYTPGEERALYDAMKDVVDAFSKQTLAEAQAQFEAREQKKRVWLQRGSEELRTQPVKGQATLAALVREYPEDAELRAGVGEALLRAGLYEEAVTYLTEALDLKPNMLPYYNVIGMALRRLSRFSTAETYYLRASQYLRHDPNLYFNLGRLYVDWKKWDKAAKAAMVALKLDPNFEEARKLLEYANAQSGDAESTTDSAAG